MNVLEKFESYVERIGLLPQDKEYISSLIQESYRKGYQNGLTDDGSDLPVGGSKSKFPETEKILREIYDEAVQKHDLTPRRGGLKPPCCKPAPQNILVSKGGF